MGAPSELTALVTGGGSGIGRAIAVRLSEIADTVVILGRRESSLRETAAAIHASTQTRVEAYPTDVSNAGNMRRLSELLDLEALFPDILVNNAGIHGAITPIAESEPEQWEATITTNLTGPYLLTRMTLPYMLRTGWGRIINVSSASSLNVTNINSEYSLSKVALNHFTRQIAREVAGTDVSATAIHPGEVKTEMWQAIRDDADSRGEIGAGGRSWARMVAESGGDPPEKAAALVLEIVRSKATEVNDRFMWIHDGIQTPRPAW